MVGMADGLPKNQITVYGETITKVDSKVFGSQIPHIVWLFLQGANYSEDEKFGVLQLQLEVNPCHTIIEGLWDTKEFNHSIAKLALYYLFDTAVKRAGLD